MTAATLPWRGRPAVIATMHGKERAMAPLLQRGLGLRVALAKGLDTDAFGTFTRDIARPGSPRETARAKIDAAFALLPDCPIGIASEGSFGPHPQLPFCAIDREIVLLRDRENAIELIGQFATPDTNFSHLAVIDVASAMAFAEHIGFPDHGVIVMGCRNGDPAPDLALVKDCATKGALATVLARVIGECRAAWIETDMRAHRNPRRMRAIKQATLDLVIRARSRCPACGQPGFGIIDRVPGLACSACGTPTRLARAELLGCQGCEQQSERPVPLAAADPAHCDACNP